MTPEMENRRQPAVDGDPSSPQRRYALGLCCAILGALGTALIGIPVIGFLVGPLFQQRPEKWRTVGPVDRFKIGTTVEVDFLDVSPRPWAGVASHTGAWLRREDEQTFIALTLYCSHLGCPVRWLPDADLFMCPCHGGVYYKDGRRAAGPPPRGLARYPVRVRHGAVQIKTTPVPLAGRFPSTS